MSSAVKRLTYEFCVPSAAVLCAVAAWSACAWFGLTAAKSALFFFIVRRYRKNRGHCCCPPLILHGKEPSVALLVRPGSNLCGLPCGSQSLSGCCMLNLCLQPDILDQCSAHPWHLGILRRSSELLFCSCWLVSFQPSEHFNLFLCTNTKQIFKF